MTGRGRAILFLLIAALLMAATRARTGRDVRTSPPAGDSRHPAREPENSVTPRASPGKCDGRITALEQRAGEVRIEWGPGFEPSIGMMLRIAQARPDGNEGEAPCLEVTALRRRVGIARVVPPAGRLVRQEPDGPTTVAAPDDQALKVPVGAAVRDVTDPQALANLRLAEGGRPDAIERLLRERVGTARRWSETALPFFEAGTVNGDRYLDASRRLLEAERESARTRDEEVTALCAQLARLTNFVAILQNPGGLCSPGPEPQLSEARHDQAQAAKWLARARRGQGVAEARGMGRSGDAETP